MRIAHVRNAVNEIDERKNQPDNVIRTPKSGHESVHFFVSKVQYIHSQIYVYAHMSKRRFTPEQVAGLLQTGHITKCSDRAMSYNKEFKVSAVRQYLVEGKSPKEIFLDAGLDLSVIGDMTPKECLKDWRRIYTVKGESGLRTESRGRNGGRRAHPRGLSEPEQIKYLEAEVAYLKAENDFLAKLRAKRAE